MRVALLRFGRSGVVVEVYDCRVDLIVALARREEIPDQRRADYVLGHAEKLAQVLVQVFSPAFGDVVCDELHRSRHVRQRPRLTGHTTGLLRESINQVDL